jgi:glycosyltransferase involved in cell wall biosynthesis
MGTIRVGFTFAGGSTQWTGGFNYLRNTFHVLGRHALNHLVPVLFVSPDANPEDVDGLAAELALSPVTAPWLAARLRARRLGWTLVQGRDNAAALAFLDSRVDVVFEAGEYFGSRFPVPSLTWVADFQSHHFPQFFPWHARWRTYFGRWLQLLGRRQILLSSRDAERDCHRFYPASCGRTVVVPFSVLPPEGLVPDCTVLARHRLPMRYLYLPNQFWVHKNHRIVIEAIALAVREVPDMVLASSGSPSEHRFPGHHARLQQRVHELGLGGAFRFLGMVPSADVAQLALHSVAVVNPSLFEGWSTTVEEAKSLGVPVVLSSIAVHREQAGDRGRYFDPHSPSATASCLVAAWRAPQSPAASRLAEASASSHTRAHEFAQQLCSAFRTAAALR